MSAGLSRDERTQRLAQLLQHAQADHEQSSRLDRERDPDWPLVYAQSLHDQADDLLPSTLSRSHLVKDLIELDNEHAARASDSNWVEFVARNLVERFIPAGEEELQLFISRGCGFCTRVLRVIDELKLKIPLRDIYAEPEARRELIAARGRGTVPVLRCSAGDVVRYMPESADIIRYLRARFG